MLHPHIPHDLKEFSKHLFATFLGLLMALGLEQWREHRVEVKVTQEALAAVKNELLDMRIHSPNHVVRVKWRHRKPLGAAHWAAPDL